MDVTKIYLYAVKFGERPGKWLATVLIQSFELFLALEKVLRWLETVLTWLKTVLIPA